MRDKEEYSVKETKQIEQLKMEEADRLAKEDIRTKAYLAKEQEIEKSQKAKDAKQSEKHASENIKASAREKRRKETYLAQEKKLAEGHEARRLKDKKYSSK
jgi:hypothetical protein